LLIATEERVAARNEELGIHWTVFRPTPVYGRGKNKNITLIARLIRRFRFFSLIGSGKGCASP